MIDTKMEAAINAQVNAEMYSAYLYLSMAAYFQSVNLPGFASWMRVQYQEETFHAMKFFDYLLERGGRAELTAIAAPPKEFASTVAIFEETLAHERVVTGLIHKLADLAISLGDHAIELDAAMVHQRAGGGRGDSGADPDGAEDDRRQFERDVPDEPRARGACLHAACRGRDLGRIPQLRATKLWRSLMLEFNADEVFEMAEQLERNGAKFYRRAAQLAKAEEHSRVLLELAAMEDAHEVTFTDMRRRLADPQSRPGVIQDLDNMAEHYLQAWADRSVFPTDQDPFEILKGGESMDTILTAAIGREKDAIVFFEGLKRSLKGEADQKRVDAIILEELDHIALLSHHRAALR